MGRKEIREQIFNLLFRVEFHNEEARKEQEHLYFEKYEDLFEVEESEYIREKYGQILVNLSEIDDALNAQTTGWKTDRMSKVDLAILRLALYEVKWDEDIPVGVAINEAVEIAKKFGGNESPAFVNGVLAKFVD